MVDGDSGKDTRNRHRNDEMISMRTKKKQM